MATPAAPPSLVERADIHKSCKSLENILNLFNEYCEAVGAVVALQKRLAKALRETAGLKATGEIAASALNGSAMIFEALLEVDTKYTKFADKEYDNISTEVKKWFKKLVKEEKAHDLKLEKANARIKQAGKSFPAPNRQTYEKKSKKNAADAAEEHVRYINIISMLGPEISQEKYNHAVNVTQRHNSTTYSVASCLARIADAEWLKACEGVRLIAPNVGLLTQWRVLCEGGWSEGMPQGLPDIVDNDPSNSPLTRSATPARSSPEFPSSTVPLSLELGTPERQRTILTPVEALPTHRRQPLPSPQVSPNVSTPNLALSNSPVQQGCENLTPPSAFDTLKPPFFDPTTGSVRTLSAFPAPPTHFPLPPVRQQTQLSLSPSIQSSVSNTVSTTPQLTESPISTNEELIPHGGQGTTASSYNYPFPSGHSKFPSPERRFQDNTKETSDGSVQFAPAPQDEARRPMPVRAPTASRPIPEASSLEQYSESRHFQEDTKRVPNLQTRDDRREQDAEFGLRGASKAHTYGNLRSRSIDRNDSMTSNGSIVAAMRDRYSSHPGSASPPPRELPRIPLSVTNLAARYQSPEPSPASRPRANSPPVARQLSFPMDQARPRFDSHQHERMSHRPANSVSTSTPTIEEDLRRRRQRTGDYTESQMKERERDLEKRERDIEARTRELERDRVQLRTVHEGNNPPSGRESDGDSGPPPLISPLRPRRVSLRKQLQRPLSQMELEESELPGPGPLQGGNQGRYGGQHPMNLVNGNDDYGDHRYSEEGHGFTAPHAPYCGCQSCSASKYGASSQGSPRPTGSNALRPPSSPEKQKSGWMRRLSIPGVVSSAFSMDSKRNGANYSLGSGVSSSTLAPGQKRGPLSFDKRKNSSATNLLRAPVEEDGRLGKRRSFDGR